MDMPDSHLISLEPLEQSRGKSSGAAEVLGLHTHLRPYNCLHTNSPASPTLNSSPKWEAKAAAACPDQGT